VDRVAFSDRTQWDTEETPYSRLLSLRRMGEIPLLDLTLSNPTQAGFEYPEAEIRNALTHVHPYAPNPQGLRSAREAIAEYYREHDRDVSPDQIVITSCTSEAYSFLFKLLGDPGDKILLPTPSYPLFSFLLESEALQPAYYSLGKVGARRWAWQAKDISTIDIPKARALVIVSPNNPTGTTFDTADLDQISAWCAKQGIPIILDEVFLDYPGMGLAGNAQAIAKKNGALLFSLGGFSKCVGLPQLKLGWIAVTGPRSAQQQALDRMIFLSDAYLTVGTPVQEAAAKLFRIGKRIRSSILARINENEQLLHAWASANDAFRVYPREGGWYAICELPVGEDDEAFVFRLLESKNVAVHPGYFYNVEEISTIVISLIVETNTLREGLLRISE
jgi:alanine-synthesizing transaminase